MSTLLNLRKSLKYHVNFTQIYLYFIKLFQFCPCWSHTITTLSSVHLSRSSGSYPCFAPSSQCSILFCAFVAAMFHMYIYIHKHVFRLFNTSSLTNYYWPRRSPTKRRKKKKSKREREMKNSHKNLKGKLNSTWAIYSLFTKFPSWRLAPPPTSYLGKESNSRLHPIMVGKSLPPTPYLAR